MRKTTLVIIWDIFWDEILLIEKKKGLGQGFWNFPGGKVEGGESTEEGATREALEETGFRVSKLSSVGILNFYFQPPRDFHNNACHLYLSKVDGESKKFMPGESDECRAFWWPKSGLSFEKFWPGDRIWVPKVLAGEKIYANLIFDSKNSLVEYKDLPGTDFQD